VQIVIVGEFLGQVLQYDKAKFTWALKRSSIGARREIEN
jgi:hypothetical protein